MAAGAKTTEKMAKKAVQVTKVKESSIHLNNVVGLSDNSDWPELLMRWISAPRSQ